MFISLIASDPFDRFRQLGDCIQTLLRTGRSGYGYPPLFGRCLQVCLTRFFVLSSDVTGQKLIVEYLHRGIGRIKISAGNDSEDHIYSACGTYSAKIEAQVAERWILPLAYIVAIVPYSGDGRFPMDLSVVGQLFSINMPPQFFISLLGTKISRDGGWH